jgi:hypothetical protein
VLLSYNGDYDPGILFIGALLILDVNSYLFIGSDKILVATA